MDVAGAAAEAELVAAIVRRRAAEERGWHDHLLVAMVAAPYFAPAIEAARWLKRILTG